MTARVMRSAVAERVRYAAVKAVEVEPDNAHPKTSIRTRLLSRAEPVTWPFNLAIDSKPRGCDVVALKVEDVAPNGYAIDRCFAFDRMVESWRFPGNHTTGACPRKPAGATWLARHSDTQ